MVVGQSAVTPSDACTVNQRASDAWSPGHHHRPHHSKHPQAKSLSACMGGSLHFTTAASAPVGVHEGGERQLKQQALLRVHQAGLASGQAKGSGVKGVHPLYEGAQPSGDAA